MALLGGVEEEEQVEEKYPLKQGSADLTTRSLTTE